MIDRLKLTSREQTRMDRAFEDALVAFDVGRPLTTHFVAFHVWGLHSFLAATKADRHDIDMAMTNATTAIEKAVQKIRDAVMRDRLAKLMVAIDQVRDTVTMKNRRRVARTMERRIGEVVADLFITPAMMI